MEGETVMYGIYPVCMIGTSPSDLYGSSHLSYLIWQGWVLNLMGGPLESEQFREQWVTCASMCLLFEPHFCMLGFGWLLWRKIGYMSLIWLLFSNILCSTFSWSNLSQSLETSLSSGGNEVKQTDRSLWVKVETIPLLLLYVLKFGGSLRRLDYIFFIQISSIF